MRNPAVAIWYMKVPKRRMFVSEHMRQWKMAQTSAVGQAPSISVQEKRIKVKMWSEKPKNVHKYGRQYVEKY